jgi:2-polyprenyl-3-methyl-5-hydroxy-6-metoxy-1,4-benzoquinol methylase
MEVITEQYRALNRQLHQEKKWGRDGHKRAEDVLAFVNRHAAASVLDYGCGRGTLRMRLGKGGKKIPGLHWRGACYNYDPAQPKWAVPKAADVVACTDVLEHVEPALVLNVLRHIRSLARVGAYLLISTRPANAILPDGRNAHLIIEGGDWWQHKIEAAGFRVERRFDFAKHVVFEVLR